MEIKHYERWFEDEQNPRAPLVLRKVVLKDDFDILVEAYREMEAKYHERGYAMRETGAMVRSLFLPYLIRIKRALLQPEDLDALSAIAKAIKELEAHTAIGIVDED